MTKAAHSMIEAVARALAVCDYDIFDVDKVWRQYEDQARAALLALRDNVTEEMVEAGSAAIQSEGLVDVATVKGFRAMLTAALKDPS